MAGEEGHGEGDKPEHGSRSISFIATTWVWDKQIGHHITWRHNFHVGMDIFYSHRVPSNRYSS